MAPFAGWTGWIQDLILTERDRCATRFTPGVAFRIGRVITFVRTPFTGRSSHPGFSSGLRLRDAGQSSEAGRTRRASSADPRSPRVHLRLGGLIGRNFGFLQCVCSTAFEAVDFVNMSMEQNPHDTE
jgi:hypothetical protein